MAFDQLQHMQEGQLYIAMAGQHQIWRHDVASGVTSAFSGDGSERNANGRKGGSTSWAQPSGLSLSRDGADLWVADSESSTVRSMRLATGGSQVSHGSPFRCVTAHSGCIWERICETLTSRAEPCTE